MAALFTRCDAHCHIDFTAQPRAFATEASQRGYLLLSSTVAPEDAIHARRLFDDPAFPSIVVGLGLHPRWVASDVHTADVQVQAFTAALDGAAFVGEVGLDFSGPYVSTAPVQQRVFEQVVQASVEAGIKALSIHAVRSVSAVLDILERTGACHSCSCVLHWFSGTSDELARARALGCWFSVGERMMAGKRGRAYVCAMPADRLLLETDLPEQPADPLPFTALADSLERAYQQVAALKGESAAAATVDNACRLIGMERA